MVLEKKLSKTSYWEPWVSEFGLGRKGAATRHKAKTLVEKMVATNSLGKFQDF